MGSGNTLCYRQWNSSTRAPGDSTMQKIKVLCCYGGKPTFEASDGTQLRTVGGVTHLVYLGTDINSYEDLKKKLESVRPLSWVRGLTYHLPGHGLIALYSDGDVRTMMEEFDELNRKHGPQMFHLFVPPGTLIKK